MEDDQRYILALDLGTQSARAIIIDRCGNLLATEKRVYHPSYESPHPGYCEQHPDTYFRYLSSASCSLSEQHPELMKNVVGVVLTTFRDTAVFLDETFQVLRPSILWLDQRISSYRPKIPWWKTMLFSLVGMQPVVKSNQQKTAAHWVKANQRELWEKTAKYVNISTYFNYLLTGCLKDSPSNMTGHYPIDYKRGTWYSRFEIKNGVFDIPKKMYCDLLRPGDVIGHITEEAQKATGIPAGLPLYASGSDKSCESLGNGCIESDYASISYGTASTVAITSKKYVEPAPFLPCYASVQKGYYNSELQIYRGYWMLNWFKDEFCKDESLEAGIQNMATLDLLNRKMMDIGPGSDGLILQPYWGPSLERPNARGAIIGFSEKHTKIHLYRAIIEGIAYCLREGKERIEAKEGTKVRYLVVSGGGAASSAICQITADIFNLPVLKAHTTETSSLGAAMCGFIAAGIFSSAQEAKAEMVHYTERFDPDPEHAAAYDSLYREAYIKLYPRLKDIYATLRNCTGEKL